jgi:hypothetical protein
MRMTEPIRVPPHLVSAILSIPPKYSAWLAWPPSFARMAALTGLRELRCKKKPRKFVL